MSDRFQRWTRFRPHTKSWLVEKGAVRITPPNAKGKYKFAKAAGTTLVYVLQTRV